jgi:hypothetical protein
MDDEDDDGKDRLFRERRMLLGVSAVLLARQFLGVTVTKSVESLGLHFEFENPERLFWAVWILWGWSLVCYVQQLNSMRIFATYPRDRQIQTHRTWANNWIRRAVTRNVRGAFRRQIAKANRVKVTFEKQYRASNVTNPDVVHDFYVKWKLEPENPNAVNLLDDAGTRAGWHIKHSGVSKERDGTRGRSGSVLVPQRVAERGRLLKVLAFVWTLASTSFATDYIAPIVIALLPPSIAGEQYLASKMQHSNLTHASKKAAPVMSRLRVPF